MVTHRDAVSDAIDVEIAARENKPVVSKMEITEPDLIHKPPHYAGKIECIDAMQSMSRPEEFNGFLALNVIKYIWRHGKKGFAKQDLLKARYYLDRLIEATA